MTDMEFAAAVRAVRAKAPKGMGDFAIREITRAALEAAKQARRQFLGEIFGEDKVI